MNERIKELAEQAGLQQRIWNSLGKELPMWQEDPDNPGLEKFAELIINRIIDNVQCHGDLYDSPDIKFICENIVNSVKFDFGVE